MNLLTHAGTDVDIQDIHSVRHDLQGAQAWVAHICGPHQLKALRPQRVRFHHAATVLKSMSTVIGYIEYGTDVTIDIDPSLLNSYSVSLPISGQQELRNPNGLVISDSYSGIVVSPYEKQELSISGDCRKIQVAIKCTAMRKIMEELLQRTTQHPIVFETQVGACFGAPAAWWRLVKYLLSEMDQSHDFLGCGAIARDIEKALIKGLILSQPNNYSHELLGLSKISCPDYLMKAKQLMHDRAKNEISIKEVGKCLGFSRFKLNYDFKKYYGTTPNSYLKRFRLESVRQALLDGGNNENITAVATRWGFNHLGRFSSDYKKLFLEAPSKTIARSKKLTPYLYQNAR